MDYGGCVFHLHAGGVYQAQRGGIGEIWHRLLADARACPVAAAHRRCHAQPLGVLPNPPRQTPTLFSGCPRYPVLQTLPVLPPCQRNILWRVWLGAIPPPSRQPESVRLLLACRHDFVSARQPAHHYDFHQPDGKRSQHHYERHYFYVEQGRPLYRQRDIQRQHRRAHT